MNTGIQDAVDLGWKLEATIRGWGGAELLALLRDRAAAGRGAQRWRSKLKSRAACCRRASGCRRRTSSSRAAGRRSPEGLRGVVHRHDEARVVHARLPSRLSLRGLAGRSGRTARRSRRSKPRPIPRPRGPGIAHRTSVCPTGARRWICSAAASCCFRLGARRARRASVCVAPRQPPAMPLEIVDLDLPEVTSLYQRRLVLVRPDGHVAWRADADPDDAAAVIDVVRGARSYANLALPGDNDNEAGPAAHAAQVDGRPVMNQDMLAPYYRDLGRLNLLPGWARPAPALWPRTAADVQAGALALRRRPRRARTGRRVRAGRAGRAAQPDPGQSDRGQRLRYQPQHRRRPTRW